MGSESKVGWTWRDRSTFTVCVRACVCVCVQGDVYIWGGARPSYTSIRGDLPRPRLSLAQRSKDVNKGNSTGSIEISKTINVL